MRIVFWGTPQPAVPSLEAFVAADDVEVVAVVTNPDRPAGRGHKLQPSPVKKAALAAGLDVWQPAKPSELIDDLLAADVDACAVVAYGAILPPKVLQVPAHGFVNLHFSLLPRWRGAAPVNHALLAGDERMGVTCFVLDAGMDTGPVLSMSETDVQPDETAGDLVARLADLGGPVLVNAVRGLVAGTLEPKEQDHDRATLAPKISPADARIDWGRPAADIERAVRAYQPMPGAHTTLHSERLKVHRSEPAGDGDRAAPGTVVHADADGPVVACGDGALRLTQVQPAGKPRMAGGDFVNGYRPQGAVLGMDNSEGGA